MKRLTKDNANVRSKKSVLHLVLELENVYRILLKIKMIFVMLSHVQFSDFVALLLYSELRIPRFYLVLIFFIAVLVFDGAILQLRFSVHPQRG